MQWLLVILTIGVLGILPGCASVTGLMPFNKDANQAIQQPFNDIEIPTSMARVSGGYSTVGVDGQTNGLACYEGYIQPVNLQYDMDRSLKAMGWKAVSGAGTPRHLVAVYTREQRYAIIDIRALTVGTALNVWVSSALKNGLLPPPFSPVKTDKKTEQAAQQGMLEGGGNIINTAPIGTGSTRHESGLQEKEL